ncbi:hypothetical protein GJAV_G00051120 [Gymnothorax javanicus]|nr:hypothetical protein GJAV_G00051120 [Gymnothorax javanicus]
MIPSYVLDRDRPYVRLRFTAFAVGTVCLPLVGLISCIFVSCFFHFEEAMRTHCRVPNYLPSISASIGLTPERYIWRFCIGLHSAPRFLIAVAYFAFYQRRVTRNFKAVLLRYLCLICAFVENSGLLVLTFVSSNEAFNIHSKGFMVFSGSALIHMVITWGLWEVIGMYSVNHELLKSYRWKKRLCISSLILSAVAGAFYWKHNKYCEPGVYTLFALSEYLMVLCNMAFHMTAYWDFGDKELTVATPPETKPL